MKYCLITFRSVTPAQRGENMLHKSGIDCALSRTPRLMEEQGCGYSLRVRPEDIHRAVVLLRRHQLAYRKIYLCAEDGLTEEIAI